MRPLSAAALAALLGFSCRAHPTDVAGDGSGPASSRASNADAARALVMPHAPPPKPARQRAAPPTPPKAGELVAVPGGHFSAGSTPGDEGREPRMEPASLDVSLGPYEIDRLSYPNDPALPARTDVSRPEAEHLCAARGERLCTELEWEYACKGAALDMFAGGDDWPPECRASPAACGSRFGVLGLGAMREWSLGEVVPIDKGDSKLGVVRGADPDAPVPDHRCAHRNAADASRHDAKLGLRCCRGAPNAATIPAPRLGPTTRKLGLDAANVGDILATVPELAGLSYPIRFFAEPDDTATVLRRGKAKTTDTEGFTLTASPLVWNPAPGDELLVVLARSGRDSFLVALYRLPDGRHRLAASLVFANDPGPFALAYHPEIRERLIWSSCWKCQGEGGTVSLRDGRRVVIVQQ